MARSRLTSFHLYLYAVALAGVLLFGKALIGLTLQQFDLLFLLLLAMVIISAFATTSIQVHDTGITYATSAAISLAAVAIWGIDAALLLMTIDTICIWLFKPAHETTWKKRWSQLAFNVGMLNIAMWVSGSTLLFLRNVFVGSGHAQQWQLVAWELFAWIMAAVIYAELNLALLLAVVRLQNGPAVDLRQMWRAERWATQIDILLLSVGGLSLSVATARFGLLGTLIFFLPILLSAYAFYLYVREMRIHMGNLEQMVAKRTHELAAQTELLAKLNGEKDAFLAVLTHDMVTPLTSMQVAIDLLQNNPRLALENPDLLPLLQRNQQILLQITHNILDISKLQANVPLQPQKEIYDLGEQIEEIATQVRMTAANKDISIMVAVTTSPLLIYADPLYMERILFNLLSNGIKYSFKGHTVAVRATEENEQIVLEVRDEGYGIPLADLPQIFERFYRVGEHKEKAIGTGLGLAIVKALVEAHDGQIDVTSIVGVGSTFLVTLPAPAF